MPSTPKRSKQQDGSGGHRSSQASSPLARPAAAVKEPKGKPVQIPDSKPKPAVKNLTKRQPNRAPAVKSSRGSRSTPTVSRAANRHSITTSQLADQTSTKTSNSTQNAGELKTSKVAATGRTPIRAVSSAIATRSNERTVQGGRRDPYLILSDSEDSDHKSTPNLTRHESSVSRWARLGNVDHGSIPPSTSTPIPAPAEPSAPTMSSQDTRVLVAFRHKQPRIAAQLPPDIEVISLDSSNNEASSYSITSNSHSEAKRRSNVDSPDPDQILSESAVTSVDGNSSNERVASSTASTHLRSSTLDGRSPSQHPPPRIPAETGTALETKVSRQSDIEGESGGMAAPVYPSAKAVGKRSSHSINSHLDIIVEKTRDTGRVVSNRTPPKSSSKYPSKVLSGHPKRDAQQTKSGESQGNAKPGALPKSSSSSRAVIRSAKETPRVRFEEDVKDESAPEASFEKSECTDDECRPSSANEEQSSKGSDDDESISQHSQAGDLLHSAQSLEPSQLSPGRTLRSGTCSKPVTSPLPISKVGPKLREPVTKSPVKSKSGQGKFPGPNEFGGVIGGVTLQPSLNLVPDSRDDNEGPVASRPIKPEKKSCWTPRSWMHKYEVLFSYDARQEPGALWIASGPFEGAILEGPGAGGYRPGYKAPDEKTIAEAEKTARPNWIQISTDSEDDRLLNTEASCEDEASAKLSTSHIHQDMVTANGLEEAVTNSERDLRRPAPSHVLSASPKSSQKARLVPEPDDKITERAERMKRTKQYVLAGVSKGIKSQQIADFYTSTSRTVSGSLSTNLAPTATSKHIPTPLSAASETTSTLITQQLIDDCVPPSNQELAELMSSSPAVRQVWGSSPAHKVNKQSGHVDGYMSSSSSEPSSGIPAHLPDKTPSRPLAAPRRQYATSRLDHPGALQVLNGIAERRTTRPLIDRSPPLVKPSQRNHGAEQVGADTTSKSLIPAKGAPTKANIMVELPYLTADKRAEYKATSQVEETDSLITLKSFKEFNKEIDEASKGMDIESNDSDEENLQYVLRHAHEWLNSTTEPDETGITPANVAKLSSSSPAAVSLPKLLRAPEPVALQPDQLHPITSEIAAPPTGHSWHTVPRDEQKRTILEGKGRKKGKRDTSASDASSADEAPVTKKRRIDDQNHSECLSRKQRRRRYKRMEQQQKPGNTPPPH
ncbi:hypothetical protein F5Y13DRAFT_199712 [Hypoxylon sp. FL1857]|nr:hypothetical protein F5Y13DRAFT_199712 [Hypoxylon sp. FL1857]